MRCSEHSYPFDNVYIIYTNSARNPGVSFCLILFFYLIKISQLY